VSGLFEEVHGFFRVYILKQNCFKRIEKNPREKKERQQHVFVSQTLFCYPSPVSMSMSGKRNFDDEDIDELIDSGLLPDAKRTHAVSDDQDAPATENNNVRTEDDLVLPAIAMVDTLETQIATATRTLTMLPPRRPQSSFLTNTTMTPAMQFSQSVSSALIDAPIDNIRRYDIAEIPYNDTRQRGYYITTFGTGNNINEDNFGRFKASFAIAIQETVNHLYERGVFEPVQVSEESPFYCRINGNQVRITSNIFTFGRNGIADIVGNSYRRRTPQSGLEPDQRYSLEDTNMISRVQWIGYILADRIVILDGWSMNGTSASLCSPNSETVKSDSFSRKILVVKRTGVPIKIGIPRRAGTGNMTDPNIYPHLLLDVQPNTTQRERLCSVCFQTPPTTAHFDTCKHSILCTACAAYPERFNYTCPLCRAEFTRMVENGNGEFQTSVLAR